jgi:hypothetical protein
MVKLLGHWTHRNPPYNLDPGLIERNEHIRLVRVLAFERQLFARYGFASECRHFALIVSA